MGPKKTNRFFENEPSQLCGSVESLDILVAVAALVFRSRESAKSVAKLSTENIGIRWEILPPNYRKYSNKRRTQMSAAAKQAPQQSSGG